MPAMVRDFFFHRLPRRFLRILLRRVGREVDDVDAPMPVQPLLDFLARMMCRAIYPEQNLPAWALCQYHLQPPDGGVRVLPVNTEGRGLCARPQMQRAVDVLGLLLACPVGD